MRVVSLYESNKVRGYRRRFNRESKKQNRHLQKLIKKNAAANPQFLETNDNKETDAS